jgi:folate-binding protein YgfZ
MHPEWQTYITEHGAVVEKGHVAHFGNVVEENKALDGQKVFMDLSFYGLLRISGEDAESFLQGQLSNDVQQVDDSHWQLSSYNSPKGRMYSIFTLFKKDNAFYLLLPREIIEPVLKRLRMFVLRSKVEISDESDQKILFALQAPDLKKDFDNLDMQLPGEKYAASHQDQVSTLALDDDTARCLIIADEKSAQTIREKLGEYKNAGYSTWALSQTRAGIPDIVAATQEEFVPQMVNLQLINGVSFTKGCYPGQEVVARMHYLGKQKKQMYRIAIESDDCPAPNTSIYEHASDNQQSVGQIVQATLSDKNKVEALAVLQIKSAENSELRVGESNGAKANVLELPYAFETAE